MTEPRDPAQLIIIATGSCLPPLLPWPRAPPSKGPAEPREAQAGGYLWPKGPQTSKGQALRGPLSCSPDS
ncbi:uncharacterized protein AKAME5_001069300 [Lates japonicus]|uniref:Uncharacterized protein n=1 Tax=Lates japonicus TaxID=270547 RepID=A0AAD3MSJ8_LATJO|nr:uncharacterized protein AKAME5_001069300 [Lates japonicus]